MILRNIGTKIVNVGTIVLMPGDEHPFTDKEANTPAINKLCKKKFLEKVADQQIPFAEPEGNGKEAVEVKEEAVTKEAAVEKEAGEEKPKRRTAKKAEQ